MEMESFIIEDLLNFSVPEGEEAARPPARKKMARREIIFRSANSLDLIDSDLVEEEDLEWISNKDAFPVIETFVGVLPLEEATAKQLSPVSVLERISHNSASLTPTIASAEATAILSCCRGLNVPVKARSKRRRAGRRDLRGLWTHLKQEQPRKTTALIGRKCQHCGSEKTPQWRAGPSGPKTLCNACGVRFKSGRLVPEYRPARSPSFSAEMHSNSHRKILEMMKQRESGVTSSPATGKTMYKG